MILAIIIAGILLLLLLLPLIWRFITAALQGEIDSNIGAAYGNILNPLRVLSLAVFLWYAIKLSWTALKWLFTQRWPKSERKQRQDEESPFNREA